MILKILKLMTMVNDDIDTAADWYKDAADCKNKSSQSEKSENMLDKLT